MSFSRVFLMIAFPLYIASFLGILQIVRRAGGDPRGTTQGVQLLTGLVAAATVFWQILVVLAILDIRQVIWLGRVGWLDQPAAAAAGSALFAAGLAVAVWGAWTLRESFRIGLPEKPTALITTGVYRFARNPIIFGLYCYVIGFFLIVPSLLVLASVLANLIFYHWKVLSEERFLQSAHGPAYASYCARVGRYFPFPSKARNTALAESLQRYR